MCNGPMRYSAKSTLITVLSLFTLFGAGCAEAQSTEQVEASEVIENASASVPHWNILAEESHIRFSAEQEGETFTGSFAEFSGDIRFDPTSPETGSVDLAIEIQLCPEKSGFLRKSFLTRALFRRQFQNRMRAFWQRVS